MCWINLVSNRFHIYATAKRLVEHWELAPTSDAYGMASGLYALMSGDDGLIQRALALSSRSLESFLDRDESSWDDPCVLPDLVGLSVLTHLGGQDQSQLWHRIATAGAYKHKVTGALQNVVRRLHDDALTNPKKAKSKLGHVRSASGWLSRLGTSPTDGLFDLAASPDHPLWPSLLKAFVLPLGILLDKENQRSGTSSASLFEMFRYGAHSQDYGAIVYERQHRRPGWDSVVDPQVPETWFGFDAVELCEHEVYAYHYLGFDWQAPLLFDRDVNAYQFLDQLDKSWGLVEKHLEPSTWRQVAECIEAGRCVHIVVHDSPRSPCVLPHMARAAEHYGVKLESRDVTLT